MDIAKVKGTNRVASASVTFLCAVAVAYLGYLAYQSYHYDTSITFISTTDLSDEHVNFKDERIVCLSYNSSELNEADVLAGFKSTFSEDDLAKTTILALVGDSPRCRFKLPVINATTVKPVR